MEHNVVVMMGTLRGEGLNVEEWKEQIAMLKREAIPAIAMRNAPTPAVLLDAEQRTVVADLIQTLQAQGAASAYWSVWCSLLTPDLSVAESFLLVQIMQPIPYRFSLRFHMLRHLPVLEAIAASGTLSIFAAQEYELMKLAVALPELPMHLAQLHLFQQEKVKARK